MLGQEQKCSFSVRVTSRGAEASTNVSPTNPIANTGGSKDEFGAFCPCTHCYEFIFGTAPTAGPLEKAVLSRFPIWCRDSTARKPLLTVSFDAILAFLRERGRKVG